MTKLDKLDAVGKAIYEATFDERWDDLHPQGIERAMYRDAARAALAAAHDWEQEGASPHSATAGSHS